MLVFVRKVTEEHGKDVEQEMRMMKKMERENVVDLGDRMGSSEDKGKGNYGMSRLGGFETCMQSVLNCIKVKRSMILHLHWREYSRQDVGAT